MRRNGVFARKYSPQGTGGTEIGPRLRDAYDTAERLPTRLADLLSEKLRGQPSSADSQGKPARAYKARPLLMARGVAVTSEPARLT
jgi:hypothetical protein